MLVHDVLVVGAGPAGLAVALGAARAGLDVAICERRTGGLDKACGEGLMPSTVRFLADLGVDPAGAGIRGISYLDQNRRVDADFRRGPGRGVRRIELHRAMRAAVDAAGIPMLEGCVTRALSRRRGRSALSDPAAARSRGSG
jgi:2-polyprenyl-6-methoxyphenol hydroxylase-like FAD-dependent oxidoreductase